MEITKITRQLDSSPLETVLLEFDIPTGLAAGNHVEVVKAYDGTTLVDTKTRNFTIAAAPTSNYLIDTYTGSKLALSLRRQSELFTGSVLTVRNDSNVELGIGLNGDVLDTAAILSHIGSGNGFVVDWFPQDGGAKFTQSAASNQPKIASAGAIILLNGKPAIDFDGVNDFLYQTSALSYFTFMHNGTKNFTAIVASTTKTARGDLMGNIRAGSDKGIIISLPVDNANKVKYYRGDAPGDFIISSNTATNAVTSGSQNVLIEHSDGANATAAERSYIKLNGTLSKNNISTATPQTADPNKILGIGTISGESSVLPFQGKIQEINIWENDLLSEIDNIETDINNYYVV